MNGAGIEELAGQGNIIEISLQIGTGEKLTAFKGETDKIKGR